LLRLEGLAAPLTLLVILLTYFGVAIGQLPRLRVNRATIALAGAAALIAPSAISEQEAYAALDLSTLTLLFSMMLINVNLRWLPRWQATWRCSAQWRI
jgi:Na+/H+ antiporter NhaD/arsenite permease-like protein